MEQEQITLNEIYIALQRLQREVREINEKLEAVEGSYKMDDEGELIPEFKKEIEKRRKSNNYVSHEEVKKKFLARK